MINLSKLLTSLVSRAQRFLGDFLPSSNAGADEKALAKFGLQFAENAVKRPQVLLLNLQAESQARYIADLINSDIQEDLLWTKQLIDTIEQALRDEGYSWSGTANSVEIVVSGAAVSLTALYGQYEEPRKISSQHLLQVLKAWQRFIS